MYKFFKFTAAALAISTATTAHASPLIAQRGADLRFVEHTSIPTDGNSGAVISLCHLTDSLRVFFIPAYTVTNAYALSNSGCAGQMYSDLSGEHLQDLQAAGMVNTTLPVEPKATIVQQVWGHAWMFILPLLLAFKLGTWLKARSQKTKRATLPDALVIHSLVAMSQVAVADGQIDQTEIQHIAHILTRLTGHAYSTEQVADLLNRLNPSASDLAQVGQDLTENDRQIVLEAALNIAVADGEIQPSEYEVVSALAQRMMIGADQFRSALRRIAAHLHAPQPI